MKCNSCGHNNHKGVEFSKECGQPMGKAVPLKKPVYTSYPTCGHKNRVGVKFCEECGANLGAPAAPKASLPTPAPQVVVHVQEKQKRRRPYCRMLLYMWSLQ